MTVAKATAVAVVAYLVTQVAGLPVGQLLAIIVAIDLAQFALVVENRGRIAAVEGRKEVSVE